MYQSTHPRGVRLNRLYFFPVKSMFQSTHPRGVRLYAIKSLVQKASLGSICEMILSSVVLFGFYCKKLGKRSRATFANILNFSCLLLVRTND